MSGLFTDGAVLQRGMSVPIWGMAEDGEKVTVSIDNQQATATASGGRWMVRLKPMKAGGPHTMTVAGENTIEIGNVVIGEVWLASGQSNMDLPLSMTENGEAVAAYSADPLIRQFKVPMASADLPQIDIDPRMVLPPGVGTAGRWEESSPEKTIEFSAVAYYFARDLRKRLNLPIGIINSALGGTMAQEWTSRDALLADPRLRPLAETLQPDSGGPFKGKPCGLYNAMVAPLVPYAIRGIIWYQGESDAGMAYQYRALLPGMISDWRGAWGEGDVPFLIVQLAPFTKIHPEPHESAQAELRESQLIASQTVGNAALIVTTDCGDEDDVHPRRKQPVGKRLALAARALAYRDKIAHSGPIYESIEIDGDRAILSFAHARGGLIALGGELTGFTIAGPDRVFRAAEAQIRGDQITVRSPVVPQPVAVRMGWAGYPVVNLYNKAGLPASPFRTDSFPVTTQPLDQA